MYEIAVEFKCGACGKDLNKVETCKLKIPIPISEWDKQKNWKREEVIICCDRVRMVDPNNGGLFDYPIPKGGLKCQKA